MLRVAPDIFTASSRCTRTRDARNPRRSHDTCQAPLLILRRARASASVENND